MAKRTNIRPRGRSWVVYYRVDGKQQWKSFSPEDGGKEAAELYLANIHVQRARRELRAPVKVTFGEALDEWLRHGEQERNLKASTVADYKSCAERWLRPPFGELRLEQVTAPVIERWRAQAMAREKEPLTRRRAESAMMMLHGVFERARRAYGFPRNPVADVERLKVGYSGRFDHYEPEEVWALVRAASTVTNPEKATDAKKAQAEQDAAVFLTAAFTGLRRGELLALTVRDVDFAGETIRVRGSIFNGKLTTPKSGKVRSVPMVAEVAQALARLLTRDRFTGDDDPVFVGEHGGYLDGSALRRRYVTAQTRAGLRPLRFHDLRHTFGSLAARKAESGRELQEWMGHADLKTTARYTHYRSRGGEAQRLAGAFAVADTAETRDSADLDGVERGLAPGRDEAEHTLELVADSSR